MAFTIQISSLASTLAVSFTVGSAPEGVPVQVPQAPAQPETDPQPVTAEDPPEPAGSGPPALPDAPVGSATTAPPVPPPEPPAPAMEPPAADGPSLLSPNDPFGLDEAVPPAEPEPRLLRPTDKRRFFSLSAGGATSTAGYLDAYGGSSVGFGTEMLIGAYGKRRPNLGGAFVMQYRKGTLTEVSLAGRFRARKRLTKEFALYTVFDTTLGVSVPLALSGYFYPQLPAAQLGIGWGLEAILAERVSLGLRPFAPSIVAPNLLTFPPVSLRWEFGVSMGIVW